MTKQQLTFVAKTSIWGKHRKIISIPRDVAELLHEQQKYEVILRPVGTLVVHRA